MPAPAATDDQDLYIALRYLRGLVDHLRAVGAPLAEVLEVIGFSEEDLRAEYFVPHALQDAIFATAERVTGDSNIGLHAGASTHVVHFGIVGQLALTCATGAELLDLQVRYQSLIGNGLRSVLVRDEHDVRLVLTLVRGGQPRARHAVEYTLAAQVTLARLLAGPSFGPTSIDLEYPEPPRSSELPRVLGCAVRFGQPQMVVRFPLSSLALRLAGDGGVRSALEQEARRRLDGLRAPLSHPDPDVARIKRYVADRLPTGAPTIQEAAAALGKSVRSLQRQLAPHDLAYRDVVEMARRELAERLMADASLSLLDVALLLGFSDQTTFHRAFRRWFDSTPGEYRSRLPAA